MFRKIAVLVMASSALLACGKTKDESATKSWDGPDGRYYGFDGAVSIKQSISQGLDSTAGEAICFSRTSDGYVLHPCRHLDEQLAGSPAIRASEAELLQVVDITPYGWNPYREQRFKLVKNGKDVGEMDLVWVAIGYGRYAPREVASITLTKLCNVNYEANCKLSFENGRVIVDTDPGRAAREEAERQRLAREEAAYQERMARERAKEDLFLPR